MKHHSMNIRVYYEDTDLGGVVYYANYLRFIERARSEWIREIGIDQIKMRNEEEAIFVVTKIKADYLSPAHFDDILTVDTSCLLYTSPSPRDRTRSRMPSSA